jgi:hypothetical protein
MVREKLPHFYGAINPMDQVFFYATKKSMKFEFEK